MFRPATFCWPCVSTKAISKPICRCRRACARKSSSDGTLQRLQGQVLRGSRAPSSIASAKIPSVKIDRADIRFNWDARGASLDHPVSDPIGRQSVHPARRAGGARRPERRLAAQRDARRSGDRPGDPGCRRTARRGGLRPQPADGARTHRSRCAAASISIRATSAASIRGPRTISPSRSPAAWIIPAPSRIWRSALPARACRCR